MPIIIVDTNEVATNPRMVEHLREYFPGKLFVKNIASDVQIPLDDGNLLSIERKTPKDFLASIGDGRLKEQIENMFACSKFAAIVITGKFNYANELVRIDDETTNWKSSSVRGMLRAIQMSGCILEFCPPNKYPMIVNEIWETCNNEDHRQGLQKHRIITFPPIDDRLQFIGQLPNVGIESAESLLDFAGKMEGVEPDEDGHTFGTVAQALHWLSIMAHIDKAERPRLWNPAKILTNRKFLGLASNQYIGLEEE